MAGPSFLETLSHKILLADGGMGTFIQATHLDIDKDFAGLENCSEILNQTRPDLIGDFHRAYLAAGADCIETNTFGANQIVLAEFAIAEKTYDLNLQAAQLAKQCCQAFHTPTQPRFVLGSMGPGTKLPSLGHISYDALVISYHTQALGLLDGEVDAFLLETNQDLLTIKAAIQGCRLAMRSRAKTIPILVNITIETTGTMLVGSDISAALATLTALDVDGIGLNCATGPIEMSDHIRYLSKHSNKPICVMPNAGLPLLIDGKTEYPLTPEELADWHKRFILEDGVALIGGCCGTTVQHIAVCRHMLDTLPTLTPQQRHITSTPQVSSLYTAIDLRQENALFAIGERSNANGSKKFRQLLEAENWDGIVRIGKNQVQEGSHALDVCVAYVGRPESHDMSEVLSRYRGQVTVPIVIDSTELPVIEAALKLMAGKCIINSINFEDGEEKAKHILQLAKQFGAAVVALTIDEDGMAKTVDKKMQIAHRLYDFAVTHHHLPPEDLFFDPLTFTICTGNEEDRAHGINTLKAIEQIAAAMPKCQILLGLSNISFGLKAEAREVLNSVYLHHAMAQGLTAAIIHVSKIMPLHKIDHSQRLAAERLIFNRWENNKDPLLTYVDLFTDIKKSAIKPRRATTIEEILANRIIDGDKEGLRADIDKALEKHDPLTIINQFLLKGMKVVGDLFASGEMQLPFVLQSAETMKAAVALLEPAMDKTHGPSKGTLVIATVKGDVHDIGKNLVDIILTNNGYTVINLGIKQPLHSILEAAKAHHADAIGMSGLLVKSTVIMKENLEEMTRLGLNIPVLLGGAALTRKYVENDCTHSYKHGAVYYAKDAFCGLKLMEQILQPPPATTKP